MAEVLSVPLSDATDRQLLLAAVTQLNDLEDRVSELTEAVSDLKTAVSGVAERVGGLVAPLQEALAAAQTANTDLAETLQAERDADVGEDADFAAQIAEKQAALDAALGEAQAAAGDVEAEVGELNAIAAPDADA